jgi:hypothetical protein
MCKGELLVGDVCVSSVNGDGTGGHPDKTPDVVRYPLEIVWWRDAESDIEWSHQANLKDWCKKDFIVVEVGFIFFEDERNIVIASQIADDGTIGNKTRVPKDWVMKRRKVSYGSRQRTKRDSFHPDPPRPKNTRDKSATDKD